MKRQIKTKYKYSFSIYGVARTYSPEYSSFEESLNNLIGEIPKLDYKHSRKNVTGPYHFKKLDEEAIAIILSQWRPDYENVRILTKSRGKVIFQYDFTYQDTDYPRKCIEYWEYKVYN